MANLLKEFTGYREKLAKFDTSILNDLPKNKAWSVESKFEQMLEGSRRSYDSMVELSDLISHTQKEWTNLVKVMSNQEYLSSLDKYGIDGYNKNIRDQRKLFWSYIDVPKIDRYYQYKDIRKDHMQAIHEMNAEKATFARTSTLESEGKSVEQLKQIEKFENEEHGNQMMHENDSPLITQENVGIFENANAINEVKAPTTIVNQSPLVSQIENTPKSIEKRHLKFLTSPTIGNTLVSPSSTVINPLSTNVVNTTNANNVPILTNLSPSMQNFTLNDPLTSNNDIRSSTMLSPSMASMNTSTIISPSFNTNTQSSQVQEQLIPNSNVSNTISKEMKFRTVYSTEPKKTHETT